MTDRPKRALITGITGQDGSYLAELLLEKGLGNNLGVLLYELPAITVCLTFGTYSVVVVLVVGGKFNDGIDVDEIVDEIFRKWSHTIHTNKLDKALKEKLIVIPTANLFAEAIRCIHNEESVSRLIS